MCFVSVSVSVFFALREGSRCVHRIAFAFAGVTLGYMDRDTDGRWDLVAAFFFHAFGTQKRSTDNRQQTTDDR